MHLPSDKGFRDAEELVGCVRFRLAAAKPSEPFAEEAGAAEGEPEAWGESTTVATTSLPGPGRRAGSRANPGYTWG